MSLPGIIHIKHLLAVVWGPELPSLLGCAREQGRRWEHLQRVCGMAVGLKSISTKPIILADKIHCQSSTKCLPQVVGAWGGGGDKRVAEAE